MIRASTWRHWTPSEIEELTLRYAAGFSYEALALHFGRKWTEVHYQTQVLGLQNRYGNRVYKLRTVSERFLKSAYDLGVGRWIREGALVATSAATKRGKSWRIHHEALLAFLACEDYWMEWEPDDLLQPEVRAWATSLRSAVGWRWLNAEEAGAILGYNHSSIGYHLRRGTWKLTGVMRVRRWWIRSDLVEAVAAKPEEYPTDGPKRRFMQYPPLPLTDQHDALAQRLVAHLHLTSLQATVVALVVMEGAALAQIAETLSRTETSVTCAIACVNRNLGIDVPDLHQSNRQRALLVERVQPFLDPATCPDLPPPLLSAPSIFWSKADDADLRRLFYEGHSYIHIAEALGRTHSAVAHRLPLLRLGAYRRTGVYALFTVGKKFLRGVHSKNVRRWIREGYLRAVEVEWGEGRTYRIRHDDLVAFLKVEEAWMDWQPENVIDPSLRAWATELRSVGWRWLSSAEAATRLGYCEDHLRYHLREGTLLHGTFQCNRWWVRSDHVEALRGRPELFPRAGGMPGRRATVPAPLFTEQHEALAQRLANALPLLPSVARVVALTVLEEGTTSFQIGKALGIAEGTVYGYTHLAYRALGVRPGPRLDSIARRMLLLPIVQPFLDPDDGA